MPIKLKKDDTVNLNKGLDNIIIGLGWDVNQSGKNDPWDLDASAFLLDVSGKVPNDDKDIVFYNHLDHFSGSVHHMGDNLFGGEGDGIEDSEQITIDLNLVPNDIQKIVIAVTIYEAAARKQNFGRVSNAYIRVVNEDNKETLIRFDLTENYSDYTGIVAGELVRSGKEWSFTAVGEGYKNGMEEICAKFGVGIK